MMAKLRNLNFVGLCTIFVLFLIIQSNSSINSITGINSRDTGAPGAAGSTPIPNQYSSWFNGSGSALTGYTSFANTTYGNLTVNNTYSSTTFHNGTIPVPQVAGYNVSAVNISIYSNATTASLEWNTTTSPSPTLTTYATVQDTTQPFYVVGALNPFWFNYPVNFTQLQAYTYVSMQPTDTMYFQVRNDTTFHVDTDTAPLYEKSFTTASNDWGVIWDWHAIQLNTDYTSGLYWMGFNSSSCAQGSNARFYKDTSLPKTWYDYILEGSTPGLYSSITDYPLAARWQYVALNDSDWTQNRTFKL